VRVTFSCVMGRSKHQELEAVLEQKEAEKQMIFSEMLQGKQRQEILEQRLSKMVGVLMKACQSIGIGNIEHQEARVPQQITNEAGVDAPRRYKRPRLTGDKPDVQYRATDYSQTDEWLDSLMQGMSRVQEAKGQGAFGGHGGYVNQMRITNADLSLSPRYNQPPALTEIHDVPSGLEMDSSYAAEMTAEVSRGLESIDAVQGLESISKIMSSIPSSLPIEEPRVSVPQSPTALVIKPEHGEELRELDSQSLDLDALLSSERGLSVPLASPTRPHAMHSSEALPAMITCDSTSPEATSPEILVYPCHSPTLAGDMTPSSAHLSCGQVACAAASTARV
jgi:hypothetical protein